MKQIINPIVLILFSVFILVSCNNEPSIQRYFVDNQEAPGFLSQDVPMSIVKLDELEFTEDQKEAYNSVKRLNFLGFKANETNQDLYNTELKKVKSILKNSDYNDLIDFNYKGSKILVKYVGNDTKAEEVIVLGSSKELGFGVVRVLGDNMSPEKIATLITLLQKANIDKSNLDNIVSFFK